MSPAGPELARAIISAWDEAHALAGLGRCADATEPIDWPAIRHATARPERMFCEHALTDAHCFSRHSYSTVWSVSLAAGIALVSDGRDMA